MPSLRRQLIATGRPCARASSRATTASAAGTSGGTGSCAVPLWNGASPKFSTTKPSTPPRASAAASRSAAANTSAIVRWRGADGSARRWTTPSSGCSIGRSLPATRPRASARRWGTLYCARGHAAPCPTMRHVLALLATALPAATALAQSTVVIPAGLVAGAGNSSNAFPWGSSAATFPGLRVQTVYDGSNFTAAGITAPIRILRLKWRANDAATSWTGGTFAQATIRCATAAVDHTALSAAFAANVGPNLTTVHSGAVAFLPGAGAGIGLPGTVAVDVALSTPFVYDPALGDLAIDVDCPGGSNFAGGTLTPMDVQTGAAASRVYASTNYPASNGITLGHGAVVEVVHVPVNSLLAAFTTDVSGGATPVTVHFTDRSYTNVAAGPTSWAWDFENDGVVDSTQRNPTHTYPSCGRYTVSLRVTDGVHAPSTTVRTDCIVTDAIAADFTTQFLAPHTVQFTDTSEPPATARSWDLDGDHVTDAVGPTAVRLYPPGSGPVA